MVRGFFLVSLGAFTSACGGLVRSPYSGDPATPIFDLKPADYCKADPQGVFPDDVNVSFGEASSFKFGVGGGCVRRSIVEAWGVVLNTSVMTWDSAELTKVKVGEPPKKVFRFLELSYRAGPAGFQQKWAMQWYHTIGFGDVQAPKLVWINYKKTSGTSYIPYWEGTIFLEEVQPGIVAFAMRNQVDAAQTSQEDAGSTVRDVLDKVRTKAPVPIP